jgi:cytochrome c oxidase subunit 4
MQAEDHGAHRGHPSDFTYVKIALILAVMTAIEVATYYVEDDLGSALLPILIVLMILKFVVVVSWFMHLRFDSKLFSRIFYAGLLLAVAVYLGALTAFQFFGS